MERRLPEQQPGRRGVPAIVNADRDQKIKSNKGFFKKHFKSISLLYDRLLQLSISCQQSIASVSIACRRPVGNESFPWLAFIPLASVKTSFTFHELGEATGNLFPLTSLGLFFQKFK